MGQTISSVLEIKILDYTLLVNCIICVPFSVYLLYFEKVNVFYI